jgi:hypothetical protein
MKIISIIFLVMITAGCSGFGRSDPDDTVALKRSARNLCEVMRSKEPVRPNECDEYNPSYTVGKP